MFGSSCNCSTPLSLQFCMSLSIIDFGVWWALPALGRVLFLFIRPTKSTDSPSETLGRPFRAQVCRRNFRYILSKKRYTAASKFVLRDVFPRRLLLATLRRANKHSTRVRTVIRAFNSAPDLTRIWLLIGKSLSPIKQTDRRATGKLWLQTKLNLADCDFSVINTRTHFDSQLCL